MIGCIPQTLLDWFKRDEVDRGERDGVSTAEREHIKALEREVIERDFSDTVAGVKASAMLYSLMRTCRACNVEPYAYLLHVLTDLPQRAPDADITDLLPFNFAERQTAEVAAQNRTVG